MSRIFLLAILSVAASFAQRPIIQSVVSAVDYSKLVAPGTWVAVFGTNLASSATVVASLPLPTQVDGVIVTMSGTPVALRYVSATQINALIPYGTTGLVQFVVSTSNGTSDPFELQLNAYAPAVFTQNSSGIGPAFIFDTNFRPISQIGTTPLILYASGLGPTSPAANAASGGIATPPYNTAISKVSVMMGGNAAQVLFAGLAPGLPGVYQLNVIPPATMNDNSLTISSRLVYVLIDTRIGGFPGGTFALSDTQVSGGTTVVQVAAGKNAANITGNIGLVYPVADTVLSISALLSVGSFSAGFDILPDAQPFNVSASCPGGAETILISPALGTWMATLTVPSLKTRAFDFSEFTKPNGLIIQVADFLAGQFFPGNVVPRSRVDPVAVAALVGLPNPNMSVFTSSYTYVTQGKIPPGGHFVVDSANLGDLSRFGAFSTVPSLGSDSGMYTRRADCALSVDGVLIATSTALFK